MGTKRLNVIDVTKGIGIILVVFAHVYYGANALTVIYSFHMPLFFIVSGFLFKRDNNPEFVPFLKKRIKRLLIPYVVYEILSIGCLYIAERVYTGMFDISRETYIEYFRQIFISNWSGTHVNQPLWFLPSLFIVEVLYYIVSKMRKGSIVSVSILLVCSGWLLESGILEFDNMKLPWNLDSSMFAFGFYAFGNLFGKQIENSLRKIDEHKQKLLICVGIMLAMVMIWLPLAFMNGKITLGTKILNNGFLLYITGILGTFIVMILGILLEKNRFLIYCGQYSFEIMASHYIIRNYVVRPLYRMIHGEIYDKKILGEAFVPFLSVFILSLLFTVSYNRLKKVIRKQD